MMNTNRGGKPMLGKEPSESEVQRGIIDYLELLQIFWWRQNSGMATYKDKNKGIRRVKYGTTGASDLGCIAGGNATNNVRGKYVAIEVKTPSEHRFLLKNYERIKSGVIRTKRDNHLFNQIGFVENVKDHGGIGFFASSISDVEKEFKKYKIVES